MTFLSKKLAATTMVLAVLTAFPAQSQDALSADKVMAKINDTEITLGHMLALRANLPPHYDQLEDQVLFNGILNQLIQHELLAQSVDGDQSRHTALTIENETRAIKAGQAIDAVSGPAISEEAVQAAYDAEYLQIDPETEYSAAHILVETEDEAKTLIQSLSDGGDFTELAREFSTGPSGPSGGELGWFGKGVMVEPFFDAVVGLSKGEVSDPVQTQFGWHVIKLLDTRALDRPELDAVRDQLEAELREERFEAYVKTLEDAASINRTDVSDIQADIINKSELLEQ